MVAVSDEALLEFPGFALGQVVTTATVAESIDKITLVTALRRHASGDWGDVEEMDKLANDLALVDETRILSAYKTEEGQVFWILTEADRSATTIMLPEDY